MAPNSYNVNSDQTNAVGSVNLANATAETFVQNANNTPISSVINCFPATMRVLFVPETAAGEAEEPADRVEPCAGRRLTLRGAELDCGRCFVAAVAVAAIAPQQVTGTPRPASRHSVGTRRPAQFSRRSPRCRTSQGRMTFRKITGSGQLPVLRPIWAAGRIDPGLPRHAAAVDEKFEIVDRRLGVPCRQPPASAPKARRAALGSAATSSAIAPATRRSTSRRRRTGCRLQIEQIFAGVQSTHGASSRIFRLPPSVPGCMGAPPANCWTGRRAPL